MRKTLQNRSGVRGTSEMSTIALIISAFFGFVLVAGVASYALGWCGEAAKVTQEEVGPRAVLQKYMLLKEMHAQLDKKLADIKVYENRMNALEAAYKGAPRGQWPRDDREAYNQAATELAGVKASYNDLAAQYNAKMAEVNWAFANQGELPKGATETLPRNYAPYVTQ